MHCALSCLLSVDARYSWAIGRAGEIACELADILRRGSGSGCGPDGIAVAFSQAFVIGAYHPDNQGVQAAFKPAVHRQTDRNVCQREIRPAT